MRTFPVHSDQAILQKADKLQAKNRPFVWWDTHWSRCGQGCPKAGWPYRLFGEERAGDIAQRASSGQTGSEEGGQAGRGEAGVEAGDPESG